MKKSRSLSTLINIVFTVLIIPFLVFEVINLQNNLKNADRQIKENVTSEIEVFFDGFKDEIDRFTVETTSFYLEDDTKSIMVRTSSKWDYNIVNIINGLSNRRGSMERISRYIRYVRIYIPGVETVLQTPGAFDSLDSEKMSAKAIKEYGRDLSYGKIYSDGDSLIVGYPYRISREILMIVEYGLSNAEILKDLTTSLPKGAAFTLSLINSEYALKDSGGKATGLKNVYTKTDDALNISLEVRVNDDERVLAYKNFTKTVVFFAIIYITVIAFFYFFSRKMIHGPLNELKSAFLKTRKGDFSVRIEKNNALNNEFNYIFDSFNSMNENLEKLSDTVYEQELLLKKSELKQLQTQINPHFLYNTLFLLNHFIKNEDNEQAEILSKELGTYYRYITRNASDNVTLEEENNHAKIYSEIQKARFGERIDIEYEELPESIRGFMVPRIIIQPVLENAYNYGLEGRADGGKLRVSFEYDVNHVSIVVEDNGNTLTDDKIIEIRRNFINEKRKDGEVTGIINIHRRIKNVFEKGSGLYASRSELGGLKIEIRMVTK